MTDRLPEIEAIERAREDARTDAIRVIRAIQEKCLHGKIIESRAVSDYFGWKPGRRICACCGLEEVSRYGWPFYTVDGDLYEFLRAPGQPTILNSEYVKFGDVVKYRVRV